MAHTDRHAHFSARLGASVSIPRVEWPAEIWGGYRGPVERTPAPEVAAAVAQYVAETNAWLAED